MGLGKRVNEVTIQEAIRADRWVLFVLMILALIVAVVVYGYAIRHMGERRFHPSTEPYNANEESGVRLPMNTINFVQISKPR